MGDWASLEVEALDWMPVWALTKKPLYQMETMRRNEINYSLEPEELEYMRMGRFVRLTRNGAFMSYDDFCEKHNYAMKQCGNHADIEVMCRKSRHLHAASRCSKLIVGHENGRHASVPSTKDDIQALYQFFFRCRIFDTPEEGRFIDDMTFAQHVVIESFGNSNARKRIDLKASPSLSLVEVSLVSALHLEHDSAEYDAETDFNDHRENIALDEDESVITSASTVQDEAAKVGKSKLNMMGIINIFDVNAASFHEAVRKRTATVAEAHAWERTIEQSVQYFISKLDNKMIMLKDRNDNRRERISRHKTQHEVIVRQSKVRYENDKDT